MESFAKVAKDLKRSLTKNEVEKIVREPITLITNETKNLLYDSINSDNIYDLYLIHYLSEIHDNYDSGHWVCLVVDHFKKKIYFFDPYGAFVDDGLKFLTEEFRQNTNQNNRDVGIFMKFMHDKYGYRLYYSQYKYQTLKKNINTCGRWVSLFMRHIIYGGGTEETFKKLVLEQSSKYKIKDLDVFITLITNNLLK